MFGGSCTMLRLQVLVSPDGTEIWPPLTNSVTSDQSSASSPIKETIVAPTSWACWEGETSSYAQSA